MWNYIVQWIGSWWWMPLVWIATFAGGLLLMRWIVLRIGADYFVRPPRDVHHLSRVQRARHVALLTLKYGSGLVLLAAGLLMLVTPGPGLLAMALGLSLVDFPGKRHLEMRLLCHPRILQAANRLRARHGISPLLSPDHLLAAQSTVGYSLNNTRD